jgi:hypothetical protein
MKHFAPDCELSNFKY